MGTVGEAGAPYPEAFNLQKKEKKSVASFFSSPQMCKNSHQPFICAMLDKARIRWAGKPGVAPSFPRDTLPQTGPISPTLYLLQDNQKTELSIVSISSKPGQLVYVLTTQKPQTEQKSARKAVTPRVWLLLISQNRAFAEQGVWKSGKLFRRQ